MQCLAIGLPSSGSGGSPGDVGLTDRGKCVGVSVSLTGRALLQSSLVIPVNHLLTEPLGPGLGRTCLPVFLSFCHFVILPVSHSVILSFCHSVILSFCFKMFSKGFQNVFKRISECFQKNFKMFTKGFQKDFTMF